MISTISLYPVGTFMSKDAYHLINKFPPELSLEEAYKLIY